MGSNAANGNAGTCEIYILMFFDQFKIRDSYLIAKDLGPKWDAGPESLRKLCCNSFLSLARQCCNKISGLLR